MGAKGKPDDGDIVTGGSLKHEQEPDFSGYATRAGVKCSDGRTIMVDAFKHQDKTRVPLVWQHGHSEPSNVLGHVNLENRADGVYCYGFFNDTEQGKNAKTLVQHDDIKNLSIYANKLTEKAAQVLHGFIREVSLVMAGANPGAFIDNVSVAHSDGEIVTLEDEAIIYTDSELNHGDKPEEKPAEHAEDAGPTVQDVYDAMTEEEKNVVHYMVGAALEAAGAGDEVTQSAIAHDDKKEGTWMSRNVFEQKEKEKGGGKEERKTLSHDDMREIVQLAAAAGSLKQGVQDYAIKHGIENIEILFPDARAVEATPDFDKRRTEWVAGVLNGTRHTPFTRIKNFVADITMDEARARGYIKGHMKKEEWFSVSKRTTGPTTVYKKQQLDRDDILDIIDFDVVAWMKGEMRLMLDEELAGAILIGDGREVDDEDKIKDPNGATDGLGIRSIINDHELYAATLTVNIDDANSNPIEVVEAIMYGMEFYKGSGNPTLYTTLKNLTWMLLARDQMGQRYWRSASELATEMGVANIVTVEILDREPDVFGIIVNLKDYSVGTDKGGDVTFFDDFDIDYNQYKYLLETRLSGALTKIRSALVLRKAEASETLATPVAPEFDKDTWRVTVPTVAGVVYKDQDDVTLTTAAPVTLSPGETIKVFATPTAGHYFSSNQKDEWTYKRPASS